MKPAKPAKPAAVTAGPFLTISETANDLKLSERTVRELIAAGEIKAMRLGKRIVRIPRAEIERLISVSR